MLINFVAMATKRSLEFFKRSTIQVMEWGLLGLLKGKLMTLTYRGLNYEQLKNVSHKENVLLVYRGNKYPR